MEITDGGGGLITEHTFQEMVADVRVCFQIVMMKDSCMVWVGTAQAAMGHLDLAMSTHMDSVPTHTTLLGDGGDGVGASLSKMLAMKTGLQVFVSWNLPGTQQLLESAVKKRLVEELSKLVPPKA